MDRKPKVLITSPDIHTVMDDRMSELGYEVASNRSIDNEQLYEIIEHYDGIIISSKTMMNKRMIDKAKRLKFIGRAGSGMERIDLQYAESKGISCLSSPEGNCDAVAEHAVMMILSLFNRVIHVAAELKSGVWKREENRGEALEGKTIGVIGYGHTGSAFVKRLSSFNMSILAYDKYKFGFSNDMVAEVSMDRIFSEADIVSLHIPLTDETTYLVDYDWLDQFNKQVYLINTSRGKNVNTYELLKSLQEGKVAGACLDVLENEKPHTWTTKEKSIYDRLFSLENVIITPHIAGWTHLSKKRLATELADKIAALDTTVNPLS